MLNSNQLQNVLLFPLRDAAARKNFLIACVLMFANFVVPLLPMLAIMGYAARIMRQVIDEKREPSMPEWDDWNSFLTDGLRMWGFSFIIMLPLMLFMFAAMGLYIVLMILGVANSNGDQLSPLIFMGGFIFFAAMMVFVIITIPLGVISMAGVTHIAVRRSFSAGFAFREWWPIFQKNWVGFVIYYLVAIAVSYVLIFATQILFFTIVLICLMPFIFAAILAYLILIQYTLFAHAYVEGREQLATGNQ